MTTDHFFASKLYNLETTFTQICILCENILNLMDWKFKFDDEMSEINCFNGLFNIFAFHLQSSSVFMKNNWHFMLKVQSVFWGYKMLLIKLRDHMYFKTTSQESLVVNTGLTVFCLSIG